MLVDSITARLHSRVFSHFFILSMSWASFGSVLFLSVHFRRLGWLRPVFLGVCLHRKLFPYISPLGFMELLEAAL
jgi:hypothetical protein